MSLFCCPNCMAPLSRQQNRMVCPAGHSFDMARSGYVNLLLSQQISQKHHGDDKRMVRARSAFLAGGYYDPMRQELIRQAMVEARPCMTVLDAGCGEGYYTAELVRRLREGGYAPQAAGIDISKAALQEAARRETGTEWAVASCFHLPVAAQSVDLLLSVFAPYCGEEFRRVLKPRGRLLMVIPLENHLYGLKEAIYEKPYRNTVKPFELEGFTLVQKQELRYAITLTSREEIQNLFMMTPYYYKTGAADQQKLALREWLTTPVEFAVLGYQRVD